MTGGVGCERVSVVVFVFAHPRLSRCDVWQSIDRNAIVSKTYPNFNFPICQSTNSRETSLVPFFGWRGTFLP